ncbi:hypothetical protein BIW11_10985 [Tropilaelaps mercedesae]|uniref:Uncharacterized protein n=1 Tax=Tropilaelaps mercedesae TaxID=418985 RepID=A0A1V9XD40_9ACAR|nr:hypothetical protein BIW11_10985 [Tropilaelaps mercedesae]
MYKGGLLTVASIATNPTEVDYVAQQTEWCNEMATCSKSIRSHKAEQYLQRISGDYAPTCQLYQAQCAFYEPTFFELISERLVDIGIFGRWWLINRKMLNYDINDQEFVTR